MLGIDDLRLARREPEESSVEEVRALKCCALAHEVRFVPESLRHPCGVEIAVGEGLKRFDSIANIAPEFVEILRIGKATSQSNDGDCVRRIDRLHVTLNHEFA